MPMFSAKGVPMFYYGTIDIYRYNFWQWHWVSPDNRAYINISVNENGYNRGIVECPAAEACILASYGLRCAAKFDHTIAFYFTPDDFPLIATLLMDEKEVSDAIT